MRYENLTVLLIVNAPHAQIPYRNKSYTVNSVSNDKIEFAVLPFIHTPS